MDLGYVACLKNRSQGGTRLGSRLVGRQCGDQGSGVLTDG